MDLKEFDDLINLGRVTRKVKLGQREIELATLNSSEYASAMSRVPSEASSADKFEVIQREIVAASIVSIDGKLMAPSDKAKLVGAAQLGLSNVLYTEYMKMVEEQNKTLEDAKKNS